jgi:hypothetical protein
MIFSVFLLLSLVILKYRQYFFILQNFKLNNENRKTKFGRIDSGSNTSRFGYAWLIKPGAATLALFRRCGFDLSTNKALSDVILNSRFVWPFRRHFLAFLTIESYYTVWFLRHTFPLQKKDNVVFSIVKRAMPVTVVVKPVVYITKI